MACSMLKMTRLPCRQSLRIQPARFVRRQPVKEAPISLGGVKAGSKKAEETDETHDTSKSVNITLPYRPMFLLNRTVSSLPRKRRSVWAAINYLLMKRSGDGTVKAAKAVNIPDDEAGFELFDEPFLIPATIRNYPMMLRTMLALVSLKDQRQIFRDCLLAAPDLFDAIFSAISKGRWEDFSSMCTNSAVATTVQRRFEELSDKQKQIFSLHRRDILLPNIMMLGRLPENKRPMANIVFAESIKQDSGRLVRVHLLYECLYKRISVEAKFPFVPDDYGFKLPVFVYPTVILSMNLDQKEPQWKIDEFNLVTMP